MSAAADIPDETLIAQVIAGSEDAFATLVTRYQRPLLRLARSFVRDESLAEDVVQDTWIGLLRGIEKFEGRSSFRTWLFRVLTNRAKTRGVKESRYVSLEADPTAGDVDEDFNHEGGWRQPPAPWTITPERLALSDEFRSLLEQALAELPPGQRAVVELRDIDGLDAAEVCNVLGVSETNQRVLLHRGRTKLRAALTAKLG